MKIFSFNTSQALISSLKRIDEQKNTFLLLQIPPKDEIRLRWEAEADRVHSLLLLSGSRVQKPEITRILQSSGQKKFSGEEEKILRYKRLLSLLAMDWMLSGRTVSYSVVSEYASVLGRGLSRQIEEAQVRKVLEYIQKGSDHPIIKAAIVHWGISREPRVDREPTIFSGFMGSLFLYKYGYDFRRFVVIEEYWTKQKAETDYVLKTCMDRSNVTLWLEYYAKALSVQIEKALERIKIRRHNLDVSSSLFHLNDRQKEILLLMEQPDMSITNRYVQKEFHMSQITASRDLSKLVTLGLLYPHGKGRSVYYTRV